ncbi:hypothetical protein GOP47_0016284 [Adiantum capillus-veneris]|uniref:Scarecrow-like protein 9 n=1 Tax=Adiantum capillus-veneris TaxID=13818 RepID=A0A9D4UHD5_ADICA|nr:hypothetical protein GOP47_0016284 [Adiantum capillus-veneris]
MGASPGANKVTDMPQGVGCESLELGAPKLAEASELCFLEELLRKISSLRFIRGPEKNGKPGPSVASPWCSIRWIPEPRLLCSLARNISTSKDGDRCPRPQYILAEDDDSQVIDPVELSAYQAKAFEMAALLKEDSPSLALQVEGRGPVSPQALESPLALSPEAVQASELSPEAAQAGAISYQEPDQQLSITSFPERFRNELLLNSLRGPVSHHSTPNYSQLQLQLRQPDDDRLHRASMATSLASEMSLVGGALSNRSMKASFFGNEQLNVNLGKGTPYSPMQAESQDDVNVRLHHQKPPKLEKTGQVLKPRKEGSLSHKKGGARVKSSRDTDRECVDLNDLLLQCAQAVGLNNLKRAVEILKKVKQHANRHGNGAERHAYYFAEAMEARFSGTGWPLYKGLLGRHPSSAEILRATYMYMASCRFVKAYHYFINQTILNVARGASKLHILELQVDGFKYPSLIKALASRPGGPPQVHLIGLGFPHYSMASAQSDVVLEAVQKTGRQLSDYAASCGVPFVYTAWAGVREDLCMQDFVRPYREAGEVLVVISASLLRYVMDETFDSPAVRSKLLKQGRDLNPDVYIQGIITGSYSTPFFTRRFREALFHFESVFDMLNTFIETGKIDRFVFEGEILGKAILNIVACEGADAVDRIDKYKHWQAVTEEVGFKQLPLDKEIKDNVQLMLESWHKEYTAGEESQYLLMGWKGRMLHAMSTWNASAEESVS